MSKIDYPISSPYYKTPQTSWHIGRFVNRPIPPDPSDRVITVAPKFHNRPDLLSHELYGTSAYWWVFMIRNINLIRDPVFDLEAGMTIVVPTRETIDRRLS